MTIYKYILFIILFFTVQTLEYGISICYFCQWESISACECCKETADIPSEDCSDSCSDTCSDEEDPYFSCISIAPKIVTSKQIQLPSIDFVYTLSIAAYTTLQNLCNVSPFLQPQQHLPIIIHTEVLQI